MRERQLERERLMERERKKQAEEALNVYVCMREPVV